MSRTTICNRHQKESLLFSVLISLLCFSAFSIGETNEPTEQPLPPTEQVNPLTPFHATYSANVNGLSLTTERELKPLGGNRFQISNNARKRFMGHINEQSTFTLKAGNKVQPEHHLLSRSLFGFGDDEETRFDWKNNLAHYKDDDKERSIELSGGELDLLGLQVQLALDLSAGKESFEYQIVRRGRSKEQSYRIIGHESLDTPIGKVDTIKLQLHHDNPDRSTEIWLSPKLHYQVVKFHQVDDDGDEFDLSLSEITFANKR
ncbi:DUF3108 domain-containing protein [Porticoccaceae bacterium LTM1]|nr:DUF3108 domain-containing protein [Porticoccaceae bacterium LTM1]